MRTSCVPMHATHLSLIMHGIPIAYPIEPPPHQPSQPSVNLKPETCLVHNWFGQDRMFLPCRVLFFSELNCTSTSCGNLSSPSLRGLLAQGRFQGGDASVPSTTQWFGRPALRKAPPDPTGHLASAGRSRCERRRATHESHTSPIPSDSSIHLQGGPGTSGDP